MLVARTKSEIRDFISRVKSQGKTVALVPTMGALHSGHISLITQAQQMAEIVVASIFVNPAQFGPNEDFGRYPRQEEEDCALLKEHGCDAVFIPTVSEIYGSNFSTEIKVTHNVDILCGPFRPGHFDGVALVVSKLLNIVSPDYAIFGEKDYQQFFIIKQMASDLNIPTRIIGAPTIREQSGLALSSRNKYLNDNEKQGAETINIVLKESISLIKGGADIETTVNNAKTKLLDSGFTKVDYIEVREEDNLEPTAKPTNHSRIFIAAWMGKTRLIDNIRFDQ